jgi:hypothetical protein
MLAYVHETNLTYQFQIDDYNTLWNNASAAGAITNTGDTFFTVVNKLGGSPVLAGQNLIDAWTGSTIEGVSGVTRNDDRWRIFYGTDTRITGGTFDDSIA